ncbi:MAG: multicopper oxidase domain-containing protein [Gemmatimonadaceae bacterium]
MISTGTLLRAAGIALLAGGIASCAVPRGGLSPMTRIYYIAADRVEWDYVPGGRDEITGTPFADTAFFNKLPPRPVSTKYMKTLYREYTDSSFKTLKPRPPEWEHLGFLGPVIRAVVGDTIRVVFRNNGDHPYSVHPHGVFYLKSSEGAPYQDGTSGADKADDAVPPGGTHVYIWPVPERAGPGPMDPSSVFWMYHSHTDDIRDVNSGLMGPMIITARGKAKADGSPSDVDRELVVAYAQVHEENSWDAARNIPLSAEQKAKLIPNPHQLQAGFPYFVYFSMNGFIRGALPLRALTVKKGQRVRWYLFASTNDFDAHAPHWHGNTVLIGGMRTDVASLNDMQMITADMIPDNPGTWLFHCHISMHLSAGMQARYAVTQ